MIEKDSPIKIKDVDINKTVKEFKDFLYDKLNLKSQLSKNRLGIMFIHKVDGKEIRTSLSDDYQNLIFYDGVSNSDTIFYIKDIGPQINYKLVYVLEYLGPLVFCILFFIRYAFTYKKLNPNKELQTHVVCYFFMIVFHYSKKLDFHKNHMFFFTIIEDMVGTFC